MKDKLITINPKTSEVFFDNGVLGIDGENLQGNLVFQFDNEFINGIGRLEIEINGVKSYAMLTKADETYTLPIKSFLTKQGKVELQLVIDEPSVDESTPIFKSSMFYLIVKSSINAEIEQPDEYETWLEEADAKLNELNEAIGEANNLDIDASKSGTTATITITKKDGTEKSVEILDGEKGDKGDKGDSGLVVFNIEDGNLIATSESAENLTHYSIIGNNLYLEIGE